MAELRRIGPEGRKKVVDEWAPHLPTYVDPSVSLMNENFHKGEGDEEEDDEEEQILTGQLTRLFYYVMLCITCWLSAMLLVSTINILHLFD